MAPQPNILTRHAVEIDEATLKALDSANVPEGLELEYKGELDLAPKEQRREAAKDVSAMANTAGGRLLYGVTEKILADGTKVAGPIKPLSDGALLETLSNLLATTIHPRPIFTFHRVDVPDGFVLVVDVRPSATDVYMVSGYGENRYYKRGPTGVLPMSEPEVRQAYERAATTRERLDARERELLAPELERRSGVAESILVVPLVPSSMMVDPRDIGHLKGDVETVLVKEHDIAQQLAYGLKIEADGCRAGIPERDVPYISFAALKTGVIHWTFDGALAELSEKEPVYDFSSIRFLFRGLETLELARRIYERAGYYGAVRIHYLLRARKSFSVDRNPSGFYMHLPSAPARTYRTGPVEAYLGQRGFSRILKDLVDPIFHAVGKPASPMFDESGAALPETRKDLPKLLADLL